MKLTVLTYNTLFAGYDGSDDRRAKLQMNLINDLKPDVFLMQEAKSLEANGKVRFYALEAQIGMRGFLALAPRTGQNTAIFIRQPLRPVSFDSDGANFHHVLATLKVALPDSNQQITFMSAHLCPSGPEVRRREATFLAVRADPDTLNLLTGDLNSVSPHNPEPEGIDLLPPHHRARYLADDPCRADRSVLSKLEAAGWVDIGHSLGASGTPTVPAAGFSNTEFPKMRCDYLLASRKLAARACHYEVIRTPETEIASDHYPVLGTFDLT